MLTFQLIGQIDRIEPLESGALLVTVLTQYDWVMCECRDLSLSRRVQQRLSPGDSARLNGAIEPRLRTTGDVERFEVCFIVERFRRLRRAR